MLRLISVYKFNDFFVCCLSMMFCDVFSTVSSAS